MDQALSLERAAKSLKERLVIRYMAFNGLSNMEVASGRIEHLDPVECVLFLPRRHFKRNCVCHVDPETVRLQAVYSEGRKKGPLLRSNKGGHYTVTGIYYIVKRVAARSDVPDGEKISQLTLKRTFAREWLRARGSVCSLQKQFSHRWLWSTAMYLRFVMEDVEQDHAQLMRRVENGQKTEPLRLVPRERL